jgi:hypothetical protein
MMLVTELGLVVLVMGLVLGYIFLPYYLTCVIVVITDGTDGIFPVAVSANN